VTGLVEFLEASWPYRVAAGALFFLVLGLRDWWIHPDDPKRAKEYLFLLFAMLVAIVYAVIHDEITVTISPDYFLVGKGLADDPRPLRLAVFVLAVEASYGVGLIAGALVLIANNPSPARPRLGYRELAGLALAPVAAAALAGAIGGAVNAFDPARLTPTLRLLGIARSDRTRFLIAWGIHAGSYLGAAFGTIAAVVAVRRRRRRLRENDEAPA
jgi:hypothetical protein